MSELLEIAVFQVDVMSEMSGLLEITVFPVSEMSELLETPVFSVVAMVARMSECRNCLKLQCFWSKS